MFALEIGLRYNTLVDNQQNQIPKMPPAIAGSDLPEPLVNLAPVHKKNSLAWIVAWAAIGLAAVTGAVLIIIGISLQSKTPDSTEPVWANEVVVEDCVGEKPVLSLNSDDDTNEQTSQTPTDTDRIPASSRTYASENCTLVQGPLMLINPVFQVKSDYIAARKREMVNLTKMYQIREGVKANGDPLLDAEAAVHLSAMLKDYQAAYPRHTIETRSCFRSAGTNCGRLCYATGTTDHHTGYTCDLIDPSYGTSLNTDDYDKHLEWQWLKENSYKYGFIDRFPAAWAGGSMDEPVNINADGSTGLYETWHYRYVGVDAATEIATGKYNNGQYDSLEHYLKARGIVDSLTAGTCRQ